ncbi:Glyceraldehyde-3-phosphate dehydrogenase [Phytophthora cinnamomi]|uniref:Glyceraldehyde-3-phosphate dehydrogenase n=1 Tax=Phytophthora cinnamomi TaxID=4785 RepID=UPI003559B517|nr:Glyceraldehyde-3-phosphate dehydrogenase [Phytophthora cinnamomi]
MSKSQRLRPPRVPRRHREPKTEVVAINDLFMELEYMAYLFKYDSTHGKFDGSVETKVGKMVVNDQVIHVFAARNPSEIPWGKAGATYVCESTGEFTTEKARKAAARRWCGDLCAAQGRHAHIGDGREPRRLGARGVGRFGARGVM